MSRALPKYNKRRVAIIGGAAAVALTGAIVAGTALAGETSKSSTATARTLADVGSITCPDVASQLPAIPATAQAEVDRNLTLLQTQIDEANKRLVDTVGQGGANFVQNAILGPLEDKRIATVNRIATAIGRTADKPQGLDALAPCTLNAGGAADTGAEAGAGAGEEAGAGAGAEATPSQTAGAEETGNAGDAGDAGGAAAAGAISCPDVASQLPAIPATAQAEVDRNLALLNTQLAEANKRLVDTVGQGGANFVQNAILGPLADKRKSTIDRIAISIGRTAEKPQGLDSLAACTLTK
jgi:F0F1-type ATP synthase membrane subunit b/b'